MQLMVPKEFGFQAPPPSPPVCLNDFGAYIHQASKTLSAALSRIRKPNQNILFTLLLLLLLGVGNNSNVFCQALPFFNPNFGLTKRENMGIESVARLALPAL